MPDNAPQPPGSKVVPSTPLPSAQPEIVNPEPPGQAVGVSPSPALTALDKVLELLNEGASIPAACEQAGLSVDSFHKALEVDSGRSSDSSARSFSKDVDRARLNAVTRIESVLLAKAENGDVRAATFLLEAYMPDRYKRHDKEGRQDDTVTALIKALTNRD